MKHIKIYEDFLNESKINESKVTIYEAAKLDLQNDIFDSGKGGYKDWKFEPEKKKLTVTYDIGKWDDKGRYAKEIKWLATNDRSSMGSGNQLVGHLDLYLEPHGLEVDKRRAHKYDPNTGKVELNLTDYNPAGHSFGHSVWENEVNEKAFNAEEIFFLWDETVDDDREGIESGHTDHRGKAATVFSFDTKNHKAFMDFKKKAAEYLKKQGLKHEDTGEQLFVYA